MQLMTCLGLDIGLVVHGVNSFPISSFPIPKPTFRVTQKVEKADTRHLYLLHVRTHIHNVSCYRAHLAASRNGYLAIICHVSLSWAYRGSIAVATGKSKSTRK